MRNQYNPIAEANGWEIIPYDPSDAVDGTTSIECVVTQMLDRTYGKMPDSDAHKQIFMEYKYYTDMLANTTKWDNQKFSLVA